MRWEQENKYNILFKYLKFCDSRGKRKKIKIIIKYLCAPESIRSKKNKVRYEKRGGEEKF